MQTKDFCLEAFHLFLFYNSVPKMNKKLEIGRLGAKKSQRQARKQLFYIDVEVGTRENKIIKIIFFFKE